MSDYDIALRPSYYTPRLAIFWQNPLAHLRASCAEGCSRQYKYLHRIIGVAELIPLIGQLLVVLEWKAWEWKWKVVMDKQKREMSDRVDALIATIPPIDKKFIKGAEPAVYTVETSILEQCRAHQEAKEWLSTQINLIGSKILFIHPPQDPPSKFEDEPLSEEVFSWYSSNGVGGDIQRDGQREEENVEIIYGVASQYNGCEASDRFTVPPGRAMEFYENDHTQGPEAQMQFQREQVELLNAAANKGFNGLVEVLDETTKGAVQHGYFTPTSKNIDAVTGQLEGNAHKITFSYVKGVPTHGRKDVGQFLVAAPAFGLYNLDKDVDPKKVKWVQYLCTLHAYRAQFAQVVNVAKETKQRVIFKPVAMGLGVFENDLDSVTRAFFVAAKEVEGQLIQHQVKVEFQVFRGAGEARAMVGSLKLKQKNK